MRHLSRFITVPLVLAGTVAVSIPAAHALLPGESPLPVSGLPLPADPAGLLPGAAQTLGAVTAGATQSVQEQLGTVRYWTPSRMRAAKPAPQRRDASPGGLPLLPGLLGPEVPAAPTAPTAPTVPAAPAAGAPAAGKPAAAGARRSTSGARYWQSGGSVTRTTGKVFFTMDGGDFVCSASAVRSANKDTVVTAGHCVNSGPGEFATRWAFVPAYSDGARPYGTWTARRLFAPTAWTERGNIDYDTGFAVVDTNAGRHLADTVGAQDIAFGSDRGQYAYAFGYPAVGRYDGSSLLYCQGSATEDRYGTGDQGLSCDMTDGSSGGPWLSRFDAKSGRGVLTSVNSFGYDGMPDVMWGPYFGDEIHSVYQTAQHS